MQALVRSLVRSELGSADGDRDQPGQALFLQIFQQLSSAPASGVGAAEEAAVEDLIAQHLQGLRKNDRGLDRHLRFQGLKNRLSKRCDRSVLALLFLLRGDAFAGDARAPLSFTHRPRLQNAGVSKEHSSERTVEVGWQLGGGAPTVLLEAKLVRDLLFALQGVSSDCFKLNASFEVDPAVILTRPAWVVSQRVLELATLHVRLAGTKEDSKESTEGLLQQALCEALREQLQDYYEPWLGTT